MRITAALLALTLLSPIALQAHAVEACQPFRPAGLSVAQVDEVFTSSLAQATRIPASQLDTSKTITQLVGKDYEGIAYAFFVTYLNNRLGMDMADGFYRASLAQGKTNPIQDLPIARMKELVRKAYSAGTDAPPPLARAGTTYGTRNFIVSAPSQPDNWPMIICHHDQIGFQLIDHSAKKVYTAIAREVGLEPYTTMENFVAQTKDATSSLLQQGESIIWVEVMPSQTGSKCTLLSVLAKSNSLPADHPAANVSYYGRFCHYPDRPGRGYAALFSYAGELPNEDAEQIGMAFIASVKARR